MFVSIIFLKVFEISVKNFKVSLTLIWRLLFNLFWILFTTARDAFLLNDCETYLLPSFFFPLIAKKISFLVTSWELILAVFKDMEGDNFLFLIASLMTFNFKLSDKVLFLFLIAFKITFLSNELILFSYMGKGELSNFIELLK